MLVSISGEKPVPVRPPINDWSINAGRSFNLRREASPRATPNRRLGKAPCWWFQSQARSQSPCDIDVIPDWLPELLVSISGEKPVPVRLQSLTPTTITTVSFNLRREASPRATSGTTQTARWIISFNLRREASPRATPSSTRVFMLNVLVSISGEKPVPVRPANPAPQAPPVSGFNLRREASPRATAIAPLGHVKRRFVSISGEKPVPVRQSKPTTSGKGQQSFNLRREASPRATPESERAGRRQPGVSISGEKPVPVRRDLGSYTPWQRSMFQSQARSQSPCDAVRQRAARIPMMCFNLRREASPRATRSRCNRQRRIYEFQSQARSQSPCDMTLSSRTASSRPVSISGEKPVPVRRRS